MNIILDRAKENPRWTLCRAAIGREPRAWEFMLWLGPRWKEFADSLSAPQGSLLSWHNRDRASDVFGWKSVNGRAVVDDRFDEWLEAGVRVGKWKEV